MKTKLTKLEKTEIIFRKTARRLEVASDRLTVAQNRRDAANAAYNQAWVNFDMARNGRDFLLNDSGRLKTS